MWQMQGKRVCVIGGGSGIGAALPLGRAGRGEDCARPAMYLFASEWVTGTVLDVDGGFLSGGSRGGQERA
jgi:NAD(P)-dependent dehydrogenase (short-subunit alcohol dehydrogenase family)